VNCWSGPKHFCKKYFGPEPAALQLIKRDDVWADGNRCGNGSVIVMMVVTSIPLPASGQPTHGQHPGPHDLRLYAYQVVGYLPASVIAILSGVGGVLLGTRNPICWQMPRVLLAIVVGDGMMMLLKEALMCTWPTGSTTTTPSWLCLFFFVPFGYRENETKVLVLELWVMNYELAPRKPCWPQFIIPRQQTDFRYYLGGFFLTGNGLALALTGTPRVILGALDHEQTGLTVTQTTVATDVHEPFDVELHFETAHPRSVLGRNYAQFRRLPLPSSPSLSCSGQRLPSKDFSGPNATDANVYVSEISPRLLSGMSTCNTRPCGEFGLL
jgi:hypothetical protein